MDKRFLLEYTKEFMGFRHSFHAWFSTKQDMDQFIETLPSNAEILLMLELLDYKTYPLPEHH